MTCLSSAQRGGKKSLSNEYLSHSQIAPSHFEVFQMIIFKLLWTLPHNTPMPRIEVDVNHSNPWCPKIEKLGNLQLEVHRSEEHSEAPCTRALVSVQVSQILPSPSGPVLSTPQTIEADGF